MYNKKAAIGATMTWIVATIIILFVIILFVYASGFLAGSEAFKEWFKIKDNLMEETISSVESEQILLALLQTEVDGKSVKEHIEDKGNFKEEVLKKELNPILEKIPAKEKYKWTLLINIPPLSEVQLGNKIIVDLNLRQDVFCSSYVYLKNSKVKLCQSEED